MSRCGESGCERSSRGRRPLSRRGSTPAAARWKQTMPWERAARLAHRLPAPRPPGTMESHTKRDEAGEVRPVPGHEELPFSDPGKDERAAEGVPVVPAFDGYRAFAILGIVLFHVLIN